ncbi:MAG: hypothetical protein INQ03_13310 [Candidatus Heimdallarchaeota archaeon]|nr:hypothetical protein [Candidatus Heimdallarchaeota archaeon]
MKTYLLLWHSSEGDNPLVVKEKLTRMGFKPIMGHYDLVYDHKKTIDLVELMTLANQVHETLRGSNVLYKLETVPLGED